jgi:hypothetical protein
MEVSRVVSDSYILSQLSSFEKVPTNRIVEPSDPACEEVKHRNRQQKGIAKELVSKLIVMVVGQRA